MKLILCTFAVCLSFLSAVLALKSEIRSEAKRTRAAIPKALVESLETGGETDSIAHKLDALQTQLSGFSRRLTQLEEASGQASRKLEAEKPAAADPLQAEVRALDARVRGLSEALAKLGGVPAHLNELSAYLDQSFAHLEKRMADTATPDELLVSIDWLVQRVDDIDHYFTPLYAFLGVVYDPANEDLLKAYPSIDVRLNQLVAELDALQKAVADIRQHMIVQTVIEPSKYQR